MKRPQPPKLADYGLDDDHGMHLAEGTDTTLFGAPKRLSHDANWIIGLFFGIPMGFWSLWGMIKLFDRLALGFLFGTLVGFVVFLMANFIVPVLLDITIFVVMWWLDAFAALFSQKARARLAYRHAWREYRTQLLTWRYQQNDNY